MTNLTNKNLNFWGVTIQLDVNLIMEISEMSLYN